MRVVRNRYRGFSLIELVIVMAIMLVMAAIGIPTMNYAIKDYRLRAAASSLKYVFQQGRFQSVKNNTMYSIVSAASPGGGTRVFVDLNGSGTWDGIEAAVDIPPTISLQTSANSPSNSTMSLSNVAGYTDGMTTVSVKFNARGLPCTGSNPCNSTKGYVLYLQDNTRANGFAAVSITPAGRMKTWYWSGTTISSGKWY